MTFKNSSGSASGFTGSGSKGVGAACIAYII
jgi:hypothetical protein